MICGTDARYGTEASGVVEAARAAGRRAGLSGRTGEGGGRRRPAKPDDYLTAKIDAVDALSTLLTRLGA